MFAHLGNDRRLVVRYEREVGSPRGGRCSYWTTRPRVEGAALMLPRRREAARKLRVGACHLHSDEQKQEDPNDHGHGDPEGAVKDELRQDVERGQTDQQRPIPSLVQQTAKDAQGEQRADDRIEFRHRVRRNSERRADIGTAYSGDIHHEQDRREEVLEHLLERQHQNDQVDDPWTP